MNILYYYESEAEKTAAQQALIGHTVTFVAGPVQDNSSPIDPEAEVLSVFVNSQVTAAVLDRFPKLKCIVTRSTGYDHIDVATTKQRDIVVTNVPTYGENTVAEFTFTLILALSRKVIPAYQQVKNTGSFATNQLEGFDLNGKTLGVLGTGHIGCNVIKMAHGFNMKVIAFDVFPKPERAQQLDFQYLPLNDVLAQSDIVTVHVPYAENTHHLLNAETFKLMKRGSYLINTARGPIVDTDALVTALQNGTLAGAGLDVLEEEHYMIDEAKSFSTTLPKNIDLKTVLENHYLMQHPGVIVTPHTAFNTTEAKQRIFAVALDNIVKFASSTVQNAVK